ncbi:hypothetical protein D9757_011701 [Collybiopsis confluens]|uniref:Histone-lysine N-methyltransferase, H3 lysine-79 specific n=1 Tax=Collybiopsis confluens TaxID=2823264 RepID=A0A8H5GLH0_9AGAR|nr:hypothetical protein D9757_011701 [Collybiopsis confluens]
MDPADEYLTLTSSNPGIEGWHVIDHMRLVCCYLASSRTIHSFSIMTDRESFNWEEYIQHVEQVSGRKVKRKRTPGSNAQYCRMYRRKNEGQKKKTKPKDPFRYPIPLPLLSDITHLESPTPTIHFAQVITPKNINQLFLSFREMGYDIIGLQESILFSPMAAVSLNLSQYRPVFSQNTRHPDFNFPLAELVLPGGRAFERFDLAFENMPFMDHSIVSVSPELQSRAEALQEAVDFDDQIKFFSALAYINEIFKISSAALNGSHHDLVLQGVYNRFVRPKLPTLNLTRRKGNQTYGEFTPQFLDRIFMQTGLSAGSWFVDLGSGVGQAVAQAAVKYGAQAFGIELMSDTDEVARGMAKEVLASCQVWGIEVGRMELTCGNMLKSPRVKDVVSIADVVLINNLKFNFNEQIKEIIQHMKLGSLLVSLESFARAGVLRNGTIRIGKNDLICNMFEVKNYRYESGDVSWSGTEGDYFIHRKVV